MDNRQRTRVITTFRRRLFVTLFLKKTVTYSALFLLLWGVIVLSLRVGGFDDVKIFALSFLAILILPPVAMLTASRQVPADRKLGAILDRNNNIGGLLMTSFERELGDWAWQVDHVQVPHIRWQAGRTVGLVLLALCFAATSLLLPVSVVSGQARNRLNIDDQIRSLTGRLDVLEEENLLDVEEVEARKLELEKIQNDADGAGPVKTFDALDHLEDRMNQKAAEAVETAMKTAETLAEAEALSQEVMDVSSQLDTATTKSLMDGLAESLENMLAQNEQLAEDMKKALDQKADKTDAAQSEGQKSAEEKAKEEAMKEALKKMLDEKKLPSLSPEMLQQLCESMKQCQGNAERMCENLQNGGFPMDSDMLKKLAEAQRVDKEEAQRMLSELWANCDCEGTCPSDGRQSEFSPRYTKKRDWTTDPNTPPGNMRFQKEPDEEGAEFQAKFLPPSDWQAFQNSQKIGASISAPDFDPNGVKNDHGGALRQTEGGSASAQGQTIHPQHRGPVGRFFGRD